MTCDARRGSVLLNIDNVLEGRGCGARLGDQARVAVCLFAMELFTSWRNHVKAEGCNAYRFLKHDDVACVARRGVSPGRRRRSRAGRAHRKHP